MADLHIGQELLEPLPDGVDLVPGETDLHAAAVDPCPPLRVERTWSVSRGGQKRKVCDGDSPKARR